MMLQDATDTKTSDSASSKAISAKEAHLIARADRVWIVEPHYASETVGETKGALQLREVVEPKAFIEDIAMKAKEGLVVGDFELKSIKGNAVELISSKTQNGLGNVEDLNMRALSLARIDVQLSQEKQMGKQVGVGFTSPAKGPATAAVSDAAPVVSRNSAER
jgi:hypothetical protein